MKREDVIGNKYGKLTVLARDGKKVYCRCECGDEKWYYLSNLKRGLTTSCGKHRDHDAWSKARIKDMTGRHFGRLIVVEELGDNRVLCKCDCGSEKVVNKKHLLNGDITSCGCAQKNAHDNIERFMVEHTSLAQLRTTKATSRSKSGVRGVSWHKGKGKWRATLCYKGKDMHLGYFDTIDEAAAARKEAEEKYYAPILEKYKDIKPEGRKPKKTTTKKDK